MPSTEYIFFTKDGGVFHHCFTKSERDIMVKYLSETSDFEYEIKERKL